MRFLGCCYGRLSTWSMGSSLRKLAAAAILHLNVTTHPNAEWTAQQFRECLTGEERYRFVIHDRDAIYSKDVDLLLKMTGLQILKTPTQSPPANAFCERLIGTIRRECLDFIIPLSESHVRTILKRWVFHYNRGRPQSSRDPEYRRVSLQRALVLKDATRFREVTESSPSRS
jgi:putative transposase